MSYKLDFAELLREFGSHREEIGQMTPTEREDYEIAREAYTIWRGSHNHDFMPSAWNDLGRGWQESYCIVVAHARHHEMALTSAYGNANKGE